MGRKWYVKKAVSPDGQVYVDYAKYYEGTENEPNFVALFDNEQDASEFCDVYALEHGLPVYSERVREEKTTKTKVSLNSLKTAILSRVFCKNCKRLFPA